MKKCSACGYLMDDFDPVCSRCQGRGVSHAATPPLSRPVAINVDIKQDSINGLTGALVFLLPALLVVAFFLGHIANNPPPLPPPPPMPAGIWQPYNPPPQPTKLDLGWMPIIFVSGAALGAWLASGLPRFQWKFGVILGGVAAVALALISPGLVGNSGKVQSVLLYFVFLLVMFCGGVGSILRHRNLVARDDSLLIKQVGVGALCFAMPLIGLFVSLSLGKNGSEYAASALYGSVVGFIVIGLPFLLFLLAGH